MNSVKKKELKATNQGHSGRCWMYAGLNVFRHAIINGMGIDNFEFSETYLFFYDKLERADSFLRWHMDHLDRKPGDRDFEFVITNTLQDGGWWHMFVGLVKKYGLIPKDAMKETYHSGDSEDMNSIIVEKLHGAVHWMRRNRKADHEEKREAVLEDVHRLLTLFLGEPPKKFRWSFTTDEGESTIIEGLTPMSFKDLVFSSFDLDDFVSIANLPSKQLKMNQKYEVVETHNIVGDDDLTFLNMPIEELVRAARKSVVAGLPVWFSADVRRYFHPWHSTLDNNLIDFEPIFGQVEKNYDKGARVDYQTTAGCHAMTLTGVNTRKNNAPVNWQVENSWGYVDNEEPGMDGWLSMSHSWFQEYVTEVVVHKSFLSRRVQKLWQQAPIRLKPWEFAAPAAAIRAGCVDAPHEWRNRVDGKK